MLGVSAPSTYRESEKFADNNYQGQARWGEGDRD